MIEEAVSAGTAMDAEASDGRRRMLLVRGGVLSPYSGLGGAFHDLRTSLEGGAIPKWSSAGVLEYDLGEDAPAWKRLWWRWVTHPRRVKKAIRAAERTGQADAVLVTDQEQAHLVPRSSTLPVMVYVHDFFHLFPHQLELSGDRLDIGEQRPSVIRRRDLRQLMHGLRRADALVCNTMDTASLCRTHFPTTPLDRVPYGLDVASYAPPSPLPKAPQPLAEPRCHFLVVGSHDPRKRLKFLIDALAELPDEVRDRLRVHHIGGNTCPYGGLSAKALAARASVPWTHVGSGISDDVLNLYRWHTEALLFPSAAEGFGYPPVESMAAGQPVLASDRPAHNELIPEGSGLDPENKGAWCEAIGAAVTAWIQREGQPRVADDRLMNHVSFLAPQRFHRDMAEAWDRHCS